MLNEFGLAPLAKEERGRELLLHGLIQRGAYEESSGRLLRNALRYVEDAGLKWSLLHNSARSMAIQNRVRSWVPDFEFRLAADLGSAGEPWPDYDSVFADDARLLLVEARHSIRGLPLHVLLVRRPGFMCYVMNSATGSDYECPMRYFAGHLASPVGAGAISFAGLQYLHTGIGIRVTR
jgi:hypothetical protein